MSIYCRVFLCLFSVKLSLLRIALAKREGEAEDCCITHAWHLQLAVAAGGGAS